MTTKKETALVKQLLEAGVHFGHQTGKWNPKMKKFIFGEKEGIYIIDLEKTAKNLLEACKFLNETAAAGSYILFVGTKKQAQHIIKEEAEKCGMFYVTQRWLGGALTNFLTIRKSVKKLESFEKMKEDGTYNNLSKKEKSTIDKKIANLLKNLEGVRKMDRLPGALFVVDSKKEDIAVHEANKLSIPVVALVDTDCNPDKINYAIPGNDDAIKSVNFITSIISKSVLEGRNQFLASKRDIEAGRVPFEEDHKAVEDKEVEELIEGDIRLEKAAEEQVKDKPIKKKKAKP
ncbi:MAG: 30S ribosomal protein S2 [Omnitrophica bacterium RBG_13_46_9]|nr:MAG: 30S ribosomal protein S2 [Omnitrophica bacterium RBG_13_46_9]